MTFTHEAGHILGGWCCGGTLTDADLLPWHLPYSIFQPDPHPLFTLWAGPVLGVLVPLVVAFTFRYNAFWFVTYFCMIANGAYLATAWITADRYLDTTKLLEHGAHPATIVVYCMVTIGLGYLGFRRKCIQIFLRSTNTISRDGHNRLGAAS